MRNKKLRGKSCDINIFIIKCGNETIKYQTDHNIYKKTKQNGNHRFVRTFKIIYVSELDKQLKDCIAAKFLAHLFLILYFANIICLFMKIYRIYKNPLHAMEYIQ